MLIAVVALITIVILQVGNLRTQKLMCPIYPDCQLKSVDLQRMQIALSRSGLKEFAVKDNQLLVPQQHHAQYLQVLSDQNAVPTELQDKTASTAMTNPFLSHSQQLSIQRESRNRKLQEMLMQLPFVEQACFEMDETIERGAFRTPEKSAVVTIRPQHHQPLLEQQIYTIRQLVGGAVSSLNHDRIVIVDLATGFAHQGNAINEEWEQKLNAQRAVFSKQQNLEKRLREAMRHFQGLKITVLMEAPAESEDQTARNVKELIPEPVVSSIPVTTAEIEDEQLLVGANGQVSLQCLEPSVVLESAPQQDLKDKESDVGTMVQLTAAIEPASTSLLSRSREKVTVMIEVPEQYLISRFDRSDGIDLQRSKIRGSHRDQHRFVQNWLATLKPEIEQTIRPVLAMQGFDNAPLVYNVIPVSTDAKSDWGQTVGSLLAENWPSLAVLIIGMTLISLITERGKSKLRQSRSSSEPLREEVAESNCKVPPLKLSDAEPSETTKLQLSQMIENDPDTAARVIENWIRDAA